MVGRLFVGLMVGLLVGAVVAAGLVAGLGIVAFSGAGGTALAYLAAALTGVLTGLVAGKPIWSSGAKIEAGLKAVFGAMISAGLMFALRQWASLWTLPIGIAAIGVTAGSPIGNLPAVSLPLLAAVLGGFFGIDNTGDGESEARGGPSRTERKRVAAGGAERAKRGDGAAAEVAQEADDEAELSAGRRAKR